MPVNFHEEYARIQGALKKKLFSLKKPDYAGSAEQLLELGNELKRHGNEPHAALCSMAAAQCWRAMGYLYKEAHHETEAGGLLWQAGGIQPGGVFDADACILPVQDLVPDATACYLAAIDVHVKNGKGALAASLYSELAGHYIALNRVITPLKFLFPFHPSPHHRTARSQIHHSSFSNRPPSM